MTKDNNLLGTFNLTGIPPAPRGIPQIEVSTPTIYKQFLTLFIYIIVTILAWLLMLIRIKKEIF